MKYRYQVGDFVTYCGRKHFSSLMKKEYQMYNVGDLIEYNVGNWEDSSMRTWTGIIVKKEQYWEDCVGYKISFYEPQVTTVEFFDDIMSESCVRKLSR